MGRKSRLKRERREAEEAGLSGLMRTISPDSMQALLEAASASPTSNYALPPISVAFCSFAKQRRHGQLPARPEHLARVVEAARRECADLARLEDFVPGDSQEEVVVRWAGSLHRILPGALSQPVSLLEDARRLADVIDPVLTAAVGYGLSDAIELVLRRVSHVAQTLSPGWAPRVLSDTSRSPSVSRSDLSAAGMLTDIESQVQECRHPARARMVLDRHSDTVHRLSYDTGRGTFGAVIAVRHPQGRSTPLPAGVLMNSIPELMIWLSKKAYELEPGLSTQWATQVSETLIHMLIGAGHRIIGVIPDEEGIPALLVVGYSPQQVLLVGVAASLDGQTAQQLMEMRFEELSSRSSPAISPSLVANGRIDPEARSEALMVVASPTSQSWPLSGPVRVATLQDILWMRRTAEDPSDLWSYAKDIRETHETSTVFAVDEADAWEWWRKNGKSFYIGGLDLDVMPIEPGMQLAEWEMAASCSVVERALFLLGLPEAAAWPELGDYGTVWYVTDRHTASRYGIILGDVPVALGWADVIPREEEALTILVDGLLNKLEQIKEPLSRWLTEEGRNALRVEFVMKPYHGGPAVELGSISNGVLTLHWKESLEEQLVADAAAVEEAVGTALARGVFSYERSRKFAHAWSRIPRAVRFDTVFSLQRPIPSESLVTIGAAGTSREMRDLAVHMRHSGIECKEYDGDDAKHLISRVIYPWLLHRLREELGKFSPDKILDYALKQIEVLNYHRDQVDRMMELYLGLPNISESGIHHIDGFRGEVVVHTRYVSLILEQLVASRPSGSEIPNHLEWENLLGIASACIRFGFLSEAIHQGMSNATLRVAGSFAIEFDDGIETAEFDEEAYSRCWTASTRPPKLDLDNRTDSAEEGAGNDYMPSVVDLEPGLAPADTAMREIWGFGFQAIMSVLDQACAWDSTELNSISTSTTRAFAQETFANDERATTDEYERAVKWLTLADVDPQQIEPWEVERRADRIATHPFLGHGESVYVLPWTAGAFLKTFFNYLEDGRLPWPEETLRHADEDGEGKVVMALRAYRKSRNRELENASVQALEASGLKVLRNIKPHKAHKFGIDKLSGEIDMICIDPDRSFIWVVEVKDQSAAFSTRAIMRIVHKFHGEDGHVETLLSKCDEISASASPLAASQGIGNPEREWQIHGIMATRSLCPAAFVKSPKVEFCTVDNLPTAICS